MKITVRTNRFANRFITSANMICRNYQFNSTLYSTLGHIFVLIQGWITLRSNCTYRQKWTFPYITRAGPVLGAERAGRGGGEYVHPQSYSAPGPRSDTR